MVHFVVHRVRECKLGGPVQYRWMHVPNKEVECEYIYILNCKFINYFEI
jgi:hypothetical protein